MKALLKWMIRGYAFVLSPMTGAKCRFYPTCSAYAIEAIDRHGAAKGVLMAGKRLLKCHPYHKGDMIDPVPASIDWADILSYKRGTRRCACQDHKVKDQN